MAATRSPMCARAVSAADCRGRFFELVAGSILVGHPGDEYHLHPRSRLRRRVPVVLPDARNWWKRSATAREAWRVGAAPPLPELMVLGELAQAAADGRSDIGLDEIGQVFAEPLCRGGVRAARTRPRRRKPAIAAARWKPRCGSMRIRTSRSIWTTPPRRPESARSISCGCSPACSASPRTNIWCARGCAMRRACWPTTTGPSPMSPMTSASAISPISCAPSTAPPASRRGNSARPRGAMRKIFQERLALH